MPNSRFRSLLAAFALLAVTPVVSLAQLAPDVVAMPSMVDFGTVPVGTASDEQVALQIDDNMVSAIFVTATSSNGAFTVNPMQGDILSTMPVEFEITFRPPNAGTFNGVITFSTPTNNGDEVVATIPVTGVGLGPFRVEPVELTFAPTAIGTTSAPQNLRVISNNTHRIALEIDITSPNGAFRPGTTMITLMPGETEIVPVTFTPTQAARVQSAILFQSQDGSRFDVPVSGSGQPFTVDPDPLLLPTTLTGCSSDGTLTVMPGGMLDFLAGPTSQRFVVRPNQGVVDGTPVLMNVSIGEAPSGLTSAEIVINARERGQVAYQDRVPVSVNALDLDTMVPEVNFGTVPFGSGAVTVNVEVAAAITGVMLNVTAVSDSTDFIVDRVNGRMVTITFDPQAPGSFTGAVTALVSPTVDPDCGRQVRIPVRGIAEETDVTLNPTILDFGVTEVGTTSTESVVLTNASNVAFSGSVAITPSAFNLQPDGVPGGQFNLPAGGSATFELGFSPTASGFQDGSAEFTLTSVGGQVPSQSVTITRSLPLRGQAVETELSYEIISGGETTPLASGDSFESPRTPVGNTTFFDFRMLNLGTAPVTVGQLSITGPSFSQSEPTQLPAIVNPDGVLPVIVQFSPTTPGRMTANLAIDAASFTISGVGVLGEAQIVGLEPSLGAAEQGQAGVTLTEPVDTDVSGVLSLGYQGINGADDPMAGFSSGGRGAAFTIPAGSTTALFGGSETVGLQAGTLSADLSLTAAFDVDGADVSPLSPVEATVNVPASAPGIVSVSIEERTATSFTVAVVGYSPTQEISQATFRFTARSGVSIPTSSVSPDVAGAFTDWFSESQFGGLFTLRVPFTFAGADNAVSSVAVTLTNGAGTSPSSSASVQ